ncbi:MAG TPA: class I SAM-dependent methyltransferase [Polyangiaceae bacterium]|jgi:cyclopropane fatty-acyl-phospholipid synthase-like methyltransferase
MTGPRGFPSWDELYRNDEIEKLPWFFAELDPDLAKALAENGVAPGARVLDQGTGPGTQARELAKRGYVVTASDLSPAAIDYAKRHADGAKITFAVDDVLATKLAGPFDAIFDRGCFHVLSVESHRPYAASMKRLPAPRGFLFLKTFSHLQPGEQGPHRFTREEIHAAFDADFEVLSIVDTIYQGQLDPMPKAFFSTLRAR